MRTLQIRGKGLGDVLRMPRNTFVIPQGTPRRFCSSCGASVYWIATADGRAMPVAPDGAAHYANCKQGAA